MATGIDKPEFAKKDNLTNLTSEVDKKDIKNKFRNWSC